MRWLLAVLTFSLTTPSWAACEPWTNDRGDTLSLIEDADYEYQFRRASGEETRCVTLRNPERTILSCEDGLEAEVFMGRVVGYPNEILSFDTALWSRRCD